MSLILGLWSVVLEPGKTYSQTTTPAIQITNISFGAEVKGDARTVVSIKYPEFEQGSDDEDESDEEDDEESEIKLPKLITKEAVVAVLKPNGTEQVSVNINLVEDVEVVEFSITGPNPVHLVGHYVRQEDFDQDPYSDSEYGSDDEEIDSEFDEDDSELEGLSGMIGEGSEDESMDEGRFEELKEELKKNADKLKPQGPKPDVLLPRIPTPPPTVPAAASTSTSSSSASAESSPEPLLSAPVIHTIDKSAITIDDADSADADTDMTDDVITHDEMPLRAPTVEISPPLPTTGTSIDVAPDDAAAPLSRSAKRRERKRARSNSKKRAAEVEPEAPSSAAAGADESMSSTLSKNQKKKLAKKLKGADGAAAPAPAAAAAPEKKEAPKPVEKKEAPKKEAPKTQTLAGGLIITDAKKGDGPVAKSGKKVGMRYIGKLENGKIFDSNTKGAPLVFTLGRGEVIKGWDMGIAGMSVGGERKLTIPASLAYGKRGAGKDIPPNSTLIFDIKMVSLK